MIMTDRNASPGAFTICRTGRRKGRELQDPRPTEISIIAEVKSSFGRGKCIGMYTIYLACRSISMPTNFYLAESKPIDPFPKIP
jgi:hypothetical protein